MLFICQIPTIWLTKKCTNVMLINSDRQTLLYLFILVVVRIIKKLSFTNNYN